MNRRRRDIVIAACGVAAAIALVLGGLFLFSRRLPAVPPAGYPAASFTFTWSAAASRWLVRMDGSPARSTEDGQLSAATVVILYTTVRTSRFLEYGQRPPYAVSTGSGTGVVLRDGRAYDIRWSRPAADGGTTFITAQGQPMTFARGPVWVVLASRPAAG